MSLNEQKELLKQLMTLDPKIIRQFLADNIDKTAVVEKPRKKVRLINDLPTKPQKKGISKKTLKDAPEPKPAKKTVKQAPEPKPAKKTVKQAPEERQKMTNEEFRAIADQRFRDYIEPIEKPPLREVVKDGRVFYVKKRTVWFQHEKSYFLEKGRGMGYTFEPEWEVAITEANKDAITDGVMKAYRQVLTESKRVFPQGFYTNMKVLVRIEKDEEKPGKSRKRFKKYDYITIFLQDPTRSEFEKDLREKAISKFHGGTSGLNPCSIYKLFFYVIPLNKKGGCANREHNHAKYEYHNRVMFLRSPKSKNDNCLFACFRYALGIRGNSEKADSIREKLSIPPGKVDIQHVHDVAKYFNTGFLLMNEKQEIIATSYTNDDVDDETQYDNAEYDPNDLKVHIMLMKEHYYVVDTIEYKNCPDCGQELRADNETHVCGSKMTTYYNTQVLKKRDYVIMAPCKDKEILNRDKVIFFDLETFQESHFHVPYACGYSIGEQDVQIRYGKGCMNDFIDLLLNSSDMYICAYNGSGFDFYLLLNILNERGVDVDKMILSNGSLISFKFGKNNKVIDLYKFIGASLEKACEGYKIKNAKMKFDVLKIQSWEDSEKYRGEVEPYLKYDVLALRELFFTFNDSVYAMDNVNITRFMTLSHMAYCLWQASLTDLVEIPDMEKYHFIKSATFGARAYPQQKKYQSKHYQDVVDGKMTYEQVRKSGEYIYNADATSLYASAMRGYALCEVKYPVGKSRWSEEGEKEFKSGKIGYYLICFKCPRDIRYPVLPRKKCNDMGLEWSLLDGEGIYTSVDIENALSVDYQITFKGKCLVWDKTGNVFGSYIDKYFKMKCDAEREGNEAKRGIGKLLTNALYGKQLEKYHKEQTVIIHHYQQLLDCLRDNTVKDMNILKNGNFLITFSVKEKAINITKPAQLGGFILAYSRRIMLNYVKACDPTLKSMVFTYTDTDSLHLFGNDAEKLMKLGYIVDKENSQLGYLCNDIKNDGIILSEINLCPKSYYYEYLTNDDKFHEKGDGTIKCKGIPNKSLSYELYTNPDRRHQWKCRKGRSCTAWDSCWHRQATRTSDRWSDQNPHPLVL